MLARTFIRLCALEAVRPSSMLDDNSPAWPTIAGKYVYDSRLDPIEDISADERRPVLVIYTEDEHQDKVSQSGPVFYKSAVDLVFEISVIATERAGDEAFVVGTAYTDAELEANLDAFENQIWHALHLGPTGAMFRSLVNLPALSWQSHPMRSSEEGVRVAARTIRAKINVRDVCYTAAPVTAPTGLNRLPPVLREIALKLDDSTYLAAIAKGIAVAAPVMPLRTNLESVGVEVDVRKIDTPQDSASSVTTIADNLQG